MTLAVVFYSQRRFCLRVLHQTTWFNSTYLRNRRCMSTRTPRRQKTKTGMYHVLNPKALLPQQGLSTCQDPLLGLHARPSALRLPVAAITSPTSSFARQTCPLHSKAMQAFSCCLYTACRHQPIVTDRDAEHFLPRRPGSECIATISATSISTGVSVDRAACWT